MSETPTDAEEAEPTTVEVEIRDDRSILTIEGRRDVSVVVRSESGERIYLPPENFETEPTTTTPYSTTPYSPSPEDDEDDGPETTPYSTSVDANVEVQERVEYGRESLPQGIRIVHPEPATDVRVLH